MPIAKNWTELILKELAIPVLNDQPSNAPTFLNITDGILNEESSKAGDIVCTFTVSDQDTIGITVDFTEDTNYDGYYSIDGLNIKLTYSGEAALVIGTIMPSIYLTTSNGISASNIVTTVLVDDETLLTVNNGTITQGTTKAGDVVCTFTASDEDDALTFAFTDGTNTGGYYSISGFNVLLTIAGETYLNAGNELPNVSITTNTGITASNTVSTVIPIATRYTPNLDGLTNYYKLSTGKTLSGDGLLFSGHYYIGGSTYFVASKSSSTGRFGWDANNKNFFASGVNGSLFTIIVNPSPFPTNKVYFVQAFRELGQLYFKVDGAEVGFRVNFTVDVFIDSIASKWGGTTSIPYHSGLLYDVTIGTELFTLNHKFSDYPSNIYGDKGTQLTGYNFTASQITEVPL